jgi:cell division GTPase FtsZ
MTHLLTAGDSGGGASSGTPVWVTVLVAALALVVAVVNGFFTWMISRRTTSVQQQANDLKRRADEAADVADKREEWWKRAQWAIERAYDSSDMTAAVGVAILRNLRQSTLAQPEEKTMLWEVIDIVMQRP